MDPGTQYNTSQRIQIFIHGKDYEYENGSPHVDSSLRIFQSDGKSLSRTIYQSKVYKQNTSPQYTETLVLDYYFQKRQTLTFRVYVNDEQFGVLKDIPLSHLIQDVKVKDRDLIDRHGESVGRLEIWCEKIMIKESRRRLRASVKIINLESLFHCFQVNSKKVFFKLVRNKQQKNQKKQKTIYQSQSIDAKPDGQWKSFQIEQSKLCQNNQNIEFELKLFYESTLEIQIGSVTLTLHTIRPNFRYKLKMNGKTRTEAIMFTNIQRIRDETFYDFLQSGLQIKTAVAIDFTESNGKYEDKQSKHYIGNGALSLYEEVMKNLLGVMLEYNSNKKTAVLGFGSKVNHPKFNTKGKVSHCFPINMDLQNPYIQQKNQIQQAYRRALPYIELAGPTYFARFLEWSIQQSKKMKQSKEVDQYLVVFVMTDGQIEDKKQVQKLLTTCANLPLSFITIGIGEQDFSIMHEIQPTDKNFRRNIFKFISYNKFKRNLRELMDQVLGEIPKHVEAYYMIKNQEESTSRIRVSLESDENSNVVPSFERASQFR